MSRTYALSLVTVLAVFSTLGDSSMAQAADEPAAQYHTYTFNKPAKFATLEEFIRDTYGESLDEATLVHTNIDGHAAITYWTEVGGLRDFNLLIDANSALHLMTSALIEITPDIGASADAGSGLIQGGWGAAIRPALSIGQILPGRCGGAANGKNSAAYVRCLAPWLPSKDLTLFTAKKDVINSEIPSVGAVAVIRACGKWAINGHLAYIIAVNKGSDGIVSSISIAEANLNSSPGFDIRTDTPRQIGIVGYIVQR